ncbi:MAG: ATP-binding protein [Pirellulales bacterium]|nr:ATP-binding protein [Pirellulales bacterium]
MPQPSEDQLKAQYAEIAVLAGQLAHEIKNPLSTISLNMELLREDLANTPETPQTRRGQERIDRVRRECQRLEGLLNDFLSFARAQAGRMEAVDMNQMIEELLQFFHPQAEAAQVEVVQLLDPFVPAVAIDREQMRASVLNLLINSVQAMPDGGRISVRTRRIGENLVLDLIDTGAGMDAQTISQIFDPFFSTKRGGSGLGLPAAKKIIETHGGTIRVQSEVGRGTQITIELPPALEGPKLLEQRR